MTSASGSVPAAAAARRPAATAARPQAGPRDKVGVMTGIYTGDGQRDWIFYTKSLPVFNTVLNRALQELPALPIVIEAYADPDWEEYSEMRDATFIDPKGE